MELIKESIGINETVHKGSTQTMIEGDIIVPDTKPDILKVLQVDGIACITKKTAENGERSRRLLLFWVLHTTVPKAGTADSE